MRLLIIIFGMVFLMANCQSSQQNIKPAGNTNSPTLHKVIVQEVIQTTKYTYLKVKEDNNEQWLAVPFMQAKVGETYYYTGGFEMTKFESKELKRTFASVIFLEKVTTDPNGSTAATIDNPHSAGAPMTKTEKTEVKVEKAKDGVTIAELYENKDKYAGKTVKVKGQVIKYTPSVMNKNWFHLQDGTDFKGKYDLTVSSDIEVKVGDKVTVEGKVTLNKDLGFGYFYEVLIEDAISK